MVYFFQRMASPMGRNAQWCCDTVGLSLYNMYRINKDLVSHCATMGYQILVNATHIVHSALCLIGL